MNGVASLGGVFCATAAMLTNNTAETSHRPTVSPLVDCFGGIRPDTTVHRETLLRFTRNTLYLVAAYRGQRCRAGKRPGSSVLARKVKYQACPFASVAGAPKPPHPDRMPWRNFSRSSGVMLSQR